MIERAMILLLAMVLLISPTAAQEEEKQKRYVGSFTLDEVLDHHERYSDIAFIYIPDENALETFRSVTEPVTIKMFYRTDCSDSVRECPRFIKTIQLADNPKIEVEAIGVNVAKDQPADLVAGWDIRRVPTFVVVHNSEEVGRVIETAKVKIEIDLAEILRPFCK